MEISDESSRSIPEETAFQKEVREVFQQTLGLLHIALVTHYGMVESEANELEKDLYLWFLRFCSRPGSKSPKESRSFLLVASCQFAREYQKYVIGTGLKESDARTERILDRDPGEVAREFSRSLELLDFRHNPNA